MAHVRRYATPHILPSLEHVNYGKEDVEKSFKDVIVDFNRADYYTIEEIKSGTA